MASPTRCPDVRFSIGPLTSGEIADQRGVDRFAVIGVSGGGPYAAACAHALPQRVVTAALVAGVGPMDASYTDAGMIFVNRLLLRTSRALPIIPTLVFAVMARLLDRYPDALITRMLKMLPPSDQKLLGDTEVRAMVVAAGKESFRQGARHVVRDTELYATPWGFELLDIKGEVHVFQGERDVQVPPVMGHYQAQTIPGAIGHFYEEDGHFALAIGRIDDILGAMMNSNRWRGSHA